MSTNYSDDEEETTIAEGRKEEWSDEEDAGSINPSEALAQEDDTSWSGGEDETDTQPAGAIFGSKTDPVGDLRTKAKKLNRSAIDGVDRYVTRSGDEAKKVRAARKKIAALKEASLKAIQRSEKDKNLSESAKAAQRAQHEAFTKPGSGDLAMIDKELEEQEAWLNQLLSMRRLPASARVVAKASTSTPPPRARRGAPEVEKFPIGPGNSTSTKTLTRPALAFIPSGTKMTRLVKGRSETHEASVDGDHFHVEAGSKFTITNGSNRTAVYKLFYS